jgi:5'-3' exonuclease
MDNTLLQDVSNISLTNKIYISKNNPVLLIDMSYYIFYRFFALCSWWKRAYKDEPLDIENILNNEIFMSKYHKLFLENLKKITKKHKIPNATIIFAKDCRRYNIWRNQYYNDYKKTRDDKNKRFNKNIFIYTYDNIIKDLNSNNINVITCDTAEADDIIAILKIKIRENNNNLPIYIITNDHDYLQLFDINTYIYNLKGLDLRTKSTGNPYIDLQIKIFRGDASDNITPVVNKRFNQNKLLELIHNKEMLKEFFNNNDELKKIYDRNELLIDFNKIPNEIKYEIRNCIEFI